MKVQVNSDNHVITDKDVIHGIVTQLESDLDRYADLITRVELHLSDENSTQKGGSNDIRCLIEARLAGRQPISVESRNASESQAVNDASSALLRRLRSLLERQDTLVRRGEREASRHGTIQ